jgi:hypothetical protein
LLYSVRIHVSSFRFGCEARSRGTDMPVVAMIQGWSKRAAIAVSQRIRMLGWFNFCWVCFFRVHHTAACTCQVTTHSPALKYKRKLASSHSLWQRIRAGAYMKARYDDHFNTGADSEESNSDRYRANGYMQRRSSFGIDSRSRSGSTVVLKLDWILANLLGLFRNCARNFQLEQQTRRRNIQNFYCSRNVWTKY